MATQTDQAGYFDALVIGTGFSGIPDIAAAATRWRPADTPDSSSVSWFGDERHVMGGPRAGYHPRTGHGAAPHSGRLNESTGWVPASPRGARQFGEVMLE